MEGTHNEMRRRLVSSCQQDDTVRDDLLIRQLSCYHRTQEIMSLQQCLVGKCAASLDLPPKIGCLLCNSVQHRHAFRRIQAMETGKDRFKGPIPARPPLKTSILRWQTQQV